MGEFDIRVKLSTPSLPSYSKFNASRGVQDAGDDSRFIVSPMVDEIPDLIGHAVGLHDG
jgi:hypothetical protein